jgi:hypothetical protein
MFELSKNITEMSRKEIAQEVARISEHISQNINRISDGELAALYDLRENLGDAWKLLGEDSK